MDANDYDPYDDAPTTPMSDVSEDPVENQKEPSDLLDVSRFARKESSSALSNISGFDPISRQMDHQITQTARYFSCVRHEVQELKYYKDKFELVLKHAAKINKMVNTPEEQDDHKRIKMDKTPNQKSLMAETRLSSQLIRLDSLVKASLEDQNELLLKMDHIKRERAIKDTRYDQMLSAVCRVPVAILEDVFEKMSDQI